MGTYTWRVGAYQNQAANLGSAPGYAGTPFSPGAVGAPSTTSKLVRCGISLVYEVAATAPTAIISPDWMAQQSGYVCAAVQSAGDSTVPSPTDSTPVGHKVTASLIERPISFGFSTTQGICTLQTGGIIWSQGEDRTPPGGGLQVRPSFSLNDATGGIAVFGSSSRWRYTLMLRVLWFTP